MDARSLPLRSIPFGTVYLIDPGLDAETRRADLKTIAEQGFNTVVLWPAATRWDADHPAEIAFDSIDAVMDACAELGLKAIIELQGQTPHQEAAPHSAADLPSAFGQIGNTRHFLWNTPSYQSRVIDYMQAVARHFRGHPALRAYDLFNEVGLDARDADTRRAFAEYLRQQYADDLTRLNAAWGTCFGDFAAIADVSVEHLDTLSWWSTVPKRDWLAFRHVNVAQLVGTWYRAVREVDPDTPLFVDVLGCDTLHDRDDAYYGVNDWDMAEAGDVLGLSCYANMLPQPWWQQDAWGWPMFWRSALAAAKGKQVIISELMTSNRSLFPLERSSMTDQIGLWSHAAMFHGVKGLIYWKWRPFRRGKQVGGRGLTDATGQPNEHARQARQAAAFTRDQADLLAGLTPDHAGCAILHDHDTTHVLHAIGIVPQQLYLESGIGWFQALWRQGVTPTFLAGRDLADRVPDGIHVLIVPCGVCISQAQADALRGFVDAGGTLVTESRFGRLDPEGTLWPVAPGGGLHEALGWSERSFTSRHRGRVDLGEAQLDLTDHFVQDTLDLAQGTEVAITDDTGHPILLRSGRRDRTSLHLSCNLGSLLYHAVPGATELFKQAFELIRPSLRPSLPLIHKPVETDVSILLDNQGQPRLVGITHYGHSDVELVIEARQPLHSILGSPGLRQTGHATHLTLRARSTTALLVGGLSR